MSPEQRKLARHGDHGFALRIVPNRALDDGWTVPAIHRADVRPVVVIAVLGPWGARAAQVAPAAPIFSAACPNRKAHRPRAARN